MATEDTATSNPARKKRASSTASKSGIVVSTSKVVRGEGVALLSTTNGAVMQLKSPPFNMKENEAGEIDVELASEQGKHLIDVLKKFFGGRGSGSPRKTKA